MLSLVGVLKLARAPSVGFVADDSMLVHWGTSALFIYTKW